MDEKITKFFTNKKWYEEKDLIDFSDNKDKDLIDFSDDLIPQPQTKHRKYKELRDEDLIPTNNTARRDGTARPDGVNILRNILNYPTTKSILGLSLTPNLKQKIKNLDSEASFGLANIISSLITANREKRTMRKKQLKEIIEGFITTLSVLLNPTQKY